MKRKLTHPILLLFALLAFACNDGPDQPEPKVYIPDEFVINTLIFDDGTWWAFEDSATGKKDTLIISGASWSTQQNPNRKNGERTLLTYKAKITQTSTKRELFIYYDIRWDYNWKNKQTPLVELVNFHNSFGKGTEHFLFNTDLNDTLTGGYVIKANEMTHSKFILINEGSSIMLNSKPYTEPFMEVKIIGSVIYDFNELNLLLIKNVGIAKHNLDGNYSLADYHLNPISF